MPHLEACEWIFSSVNIADEVLVIRMYRTAYGPMIEIIANDRLGRKGSYPVIYRSTSSDQLIDLPGLDLFLITYSPGQMSSL